MKIDFDDFMKRKVQREMEMYMEGAIEAANQASVRGDFPCGAVLAFPNRHFTDWDTTKSERWGDHAASNVIRKARAVLPDRPFSEATLYCSVEPCAMCAAFASRMGIREVYFGVKDMKNGFVSSPKGISPEAFGLTYRGGILSEKCLEAMPAAVREVLGDIPS